VVDFRGFMAQKDQKNKLKQIIIYYFDNFLTDYLEEEYNR